MDIVTAEEKARLEHNLSDLISRRKQIRERIGEARALGDLKENAEYHAAREDQGLNEARIRELESRLTRVSVADSENTPDNMVFVGGLVRLRDIESDDEDTYRLVGTSTGDFSLDYIEVTTSSPLGLALMKASVGETVRADLPAGPRRFEILEILS